MFGSCAQIQSLASKTLKWNTAKYRKYEKRGKKEASEKQGVDQGYLRCSAEITNQG